MYDLMFEPHDRKEEQASRALLTSGSFGFTYKMLVAARSPQEAFSTFTTVRNQMWGEEFKPQGVSQDASRESIEHGGPGVTYEPTNTSARKARIVPPELTAVQAILVPWLQIEEFVTALKAAIAYRSRVDGVVDRSGWTPGNSSDELERSHSLVPHGSVLPLYMPKNALSGSVMRRIN